MLDEHHDKLTEEQIEKEYDSYTDSLKWQLIENKILKENDIRITEEHVKEYIKDYFRKSVTSVDSSMFPEDKLDELAERFLKNKEEVKKIYDKLFDDKLKDLFKSKVKITNEAITYEEFGKLASGGHDHDHHH